MATSRNDEWEGNTEEYSEGQIESLLAYCGIEVVSETYTHFLSLCPFHDNTDSPALAVDKSLGVWYCFNPACSARGNMQEMLRRRKGLNLFKAQRVILKYQNAEATPLIERVSDALVKAPEFVAFPQTALDSMKASFAGSAGEEYMRSRGFSSKTLDYFDVGYSPKMNMVTVPMHDPKGMPIGIIGRTASSEEKRFKNSRGLPKALTAWNFHRAKREGGTVIVCEASYDAMRIHQAGYPNVIALLGGSITKHHVEQINKHFSTVVIMTDFDAKQHKPNCRKCHPQLCSGHRPGRELGRSIAASLPNKKILWAAYDNTCVFPHGAKDASDMTDEEISQCLVNSVSDLEYNMWNIEAVAQYV